jgi:hypothetical protein
VPVNGLPAPKARSTQVALRYRRKAGPHHQVRPPNLEQPRMICPARPSEDPGWRASTRSFIRFQVGAEETRNAAQIISFGCGTGDHRITACTGPAAAWYVHDCGERPGGVQPRRHGILNGDVKIGPVGPDPGAARLDPTYCALCALAPALTESEAIRLRPSACAAVDAVSLIWWRRVAAPRGSAISDPLTSRLRGLCRIDKCPGRTPWPTIGAGL